MSAILGLHLKVSSMLTGSFRVCICTEMRKPRSSVTACEPVHLLIFPPKHPFWQALNYLHSSLPKLLKYVRSWSNRNKFFWSTQPAEFPQWAGGDQTWKQRKNKGFLAVLKMPRPQQPITIYSMKDIKHLQSATTSQMSTIQTLSQMVSKLIFEARSLHFT